MSETSVHYSTLAVNLSKWLNPEEPWKSSFITAMRVVSAKSPHLPLPSKATRPQLECFRLGQVSSLEFSPREIHSITYQGEKVHINLFSLGVWGPNGALPIHLSELAKSRNRAADNALTDFTNIFHHRALSQFYRAWYLAQDTATLDRKEDELYSYYIGNLIGFDSKKLDARILPVHSQLAAIPHLIREARNPDGLIGALTFYFQLPFKLVEYVSQWLTLPEEETSRLSGFDYACFLGKGAILGSTVQDYQHKFRLLIGPLTLKQYLGFSPWGSGMPVLREWVRRFIGFEFAWDVQLILLANEIPQATLDGTHQLGYATWLEHYHDKHAVNGINFEPELHVNRDNSGF